MSQIIMRQQQGCLQFDLNLQQQVWKHMGELVYLNYRCEARQVTMSQPMKTCDSWMLLEVCMVILHQILTP